MGKMICMALAMAMGGSVIGCGGDVVDETPSTQLTAEQYTSVYTEAMAGLGVEMLEYNAPITTGEENEYLFEMMGFAQEDAEAYAISVSMMAVQAYGIVAVKPADGREQAVLDGMNGFVELQKRNFEQYLMDQYEIANAAIVETLDDGTMILVMCQDSQTVRDNLVTAIEAGIVA